MDFGTIADDIADELKRPDKVTQIKRAINNAIEYCTVNGDFAADLSEDDITMDSTVLSQSIVISTTFTRFRKIKYLRPDGYRRMLSLTDPAKIFDDKGNQCSDVWYRAGDNIVISTSTYIETLYYGYYQFAARLSADDDTHWMLTYMYSAIFNLALADAWNNIGNAEESAKCKKMGLDYFMAHRRDHQDSAAF